MKKLSIVLFFCSTYFFTTAQWTSLSTGVTGVSYSDMCFINNQIGFVAASNYIEDPLMLKTVNGGITWDSVPVPGNDPLTGIWFINDSTGFVSACKVILKTTDQGNTWDTAYFNTGYGFDQLFFVNEHVGYASYYTQLCKYGPVKFLKTVDAGNNWTVLNPALPEGYINDFYFISDDSGVAIQFGISGYETLIYATSTGGSNWTSILGNGNVAFNYASITAINHLTFMAAGPSGIVITEDGGNTFTESPLPYSIDGSNPKNDMVFTSADVGWMCGWEILKTEDGGHTWIIFDSTIINYNEELSAIKFPSPDTGFACGYYGTILKYTAPIPLAVPALEKSFELNIFPNPFSDQVTVNFSLPESGDVTLDLTDIVGKILKSYPLKNLTEGKHSYEINPGTVSSGIYLLQLRSKHKISSEKIIRQ